jgi:hypothetical protein
MTSGALLTSERALPHGVRPTVRAALYLRASTSKKLRTDDGEQFRQRPEIQEERLRLLCEQRGWEVVAVYCDRASGRKEARPELTRLMEDAAAACLALSPWPRSAGSLGTPSTWSPPWTSSANCASSS